MLARTLAGTVVGVEGRVIQVEVDLSPGLPGVTVVGLPDTIVQESRERIRSAIRNSGLTFPIRRITVNLAPATLRKGGGALDLAIALGILAGSEQIPQEALERLIFWGELGLDGALRPVSGLLALACCAQATVDRELIVPEANAKEASIVPGIRARQSANLGDVVGFLRGEIDLDRVEHRQSVATASPPVTETLDLADVRGQPGARRALEIAAAGNHNLLLVGPPGSGKTMLLSRLPSILPPLSLYEKLEVARIHSVAGLLSSTNPISDTRPFRTPHHTASDVALIGGGRNPRPGEVSLAHRGVLFLDELPEFKRNTLEVLRQPLSDGQVTVARAQASLTYPADFCLVAAMNPCPCGNRGHPDRPCRCSSLAVRRYLSRISGPLLERIDLCVEVPPVSPDSLTDQSLAESSEVVRDRVMKARQLQAQRLSGVYRKSSDQPPSQPFTNGRMKPHELRTTCSLSVGVRDYLGRMARIAGLSARGYEKVLKVARTIADLDRQETIAKAHIAEAIHHRSLDTRWSERMG